MKCSACVFLRFGIVGRTLVVRPWGTRLDSSHPLRGPRSGREQKTRRIVAVTEVNSVRQTPCAVQVALKSGGHMTPPLGVETGAREYSRHGDASPGAASSTQVFVATLRKACRPSREVRQAERTVLEPAFRPGPPVPFLRSPIVTLPAWAAVRRTWLRTGLRIWLRARGGT